METKNFVKYFENIKLEKVHNGYRYKVSEAIVIVILGLICGLKNVSQIHQWATNKSVALFLKNSFGIENIPCYYWLLCLIKLVNPESMNRCFCEWVKSLLPEGKTAMIISLDGKTVRSTVKPGCKKSPLHVVSAQLSEFGITLSQKAVDKKTNEIPTVQALLRELEISGCVIVADALNCQRKTAEIIFEKGADYILDAKGNQKNLKEDIKEYVNDENLRNKMDTFVIKELNRNRIEKRVAFCTQDVEWLPDKELWPGLRSIGAIRKITEESGNRSEEWHYYISSRILNAEDLLFYARQEWSVETMHWYLDVHFGEDFCRVLDANIQKTLNILRKTALNYLKSFKDKTKSKLPINKIMLDCLLDPQKILSILDI